LGAREYADARLMNSCPICRAALPLVSSLAHAVCPACFAIFEFNEGKWQPVPPSRQASGPIPIPLGTMLRLRSTDHRVVGFASYSYQVEYGREQWDTFVRHEYTLTDLTGGNPRLLCWTASNWFLARPVDASLITMKDWTELQWEGRDYRRQQPQTYTADRACGFLTHPFQWREFVTISDFVSERHIVASEHPGRVLRWVGEVLEPRELLTALAIREFPANSPYLTSVATPAQVSPMAMTRAAAPISGWRWVGVLFAFVATFAVIGTVAYQYERRTKPIVSHWFACEAKPAQKRVEIPPGASKVELDPHLAQGGVNYRLRILNAQGMVLESRKDFLDMNPKRRILKVALPAEAFAVDATCSVSYGVAGLPTWPVELRFFR